MAFFLTSNGKVVEGMELTVEQVTVRKELPEVIQEATGMYIADYNMQKIVDAVVGRFDVRLRPVEEVEAAAEVAEETEEELPVVEAPEPFVPVVAEVEEVPFG